MKKRHLALTAASAFSIVGTPAWAQESSPQEKTEAQDPQQVQEIVVTAQKREQVLNDVPLSITALSSDQLASRGVENATDLARVVPGFTYADTGVNAPVYSLRGVGYFDFSISAAPAVSVYLDEVPLAYPAMTQGASFDLQRVEVLRGPQGTLFGLNSTGGLVNYIAKKPSEVPEAGFSASYGRFNRLELEGYAGGPLSDTWSGRVSVKNTTAGAWEHSITRDDTLGAVNNSAGRIQLNWRPAPTVNVLFNINGYVDRSDPLAPQAIAITPLTPARVLPEVVNAPLVRGDDAQAADWNPLRRPFRDDRFWQSSARVDWDISGGVTLTSISAYSNLDSKAEIDRDGMANENSEYGLDAYIHSFFQEVRLSGKTSLLNWTVGASYGHDKTLENSAGYLATSSNIQNVFGNKLPRSDNVSHNAVETVAGFASADWRLSHTMSLTTGIRYTDTSRDFRGCTNARDPGTIAGLTAISAYYRSVNGLPPVPFVPVGEGCLVLGSNFLPTEPSFSTNEGNVSWRVAYNYQPTRDLLFYASATQGYKGGNSITVAGTSVAQYVPVRQESLLSYEAGFKATLLDGRMQLNGAGFYYDYKDKQSRSKIIDPVFGPLQALVNIPRSHAYGGELELQWLPARGLTVNGGLAYLHTEIDEWIGFDQLGAKRDFAGHPFSFAPEWQGNVDIDYHWTLPGEQTASLGASATYKSRSSADFDSNSLFKIDAYPLLDLRASLETSDKKWRFSAFVNNVTDKYYWNSVYRVQDTVVRYQAMPRTYGLGISFTY